MGSPRCSAMVASAVAATIARMTQTQYLQDSFHKEPLWPREFGAGIAESYASEQVGVNAGRCRSGEKTGRHCERNEESLFDGPCQEGVAFTLPSFCFQSGIQVNFRRGYRSLNTFRISLGKAERVAAEGCIFLRTIQARVSSNLRVASASLRVWSIRF